MPPNYHPPQEVMQKLPSPRVPITADRFFAEEHHQIQQGGQQQAVSRQPVSPYRVSEPLPPREQTERLSNSVGQQQYVPA